MAHGDSRTLSVGALVETADGETLGWVAETRGDYLCVDPGEGDAYWLVVRDMGSMSPDRIQVEFSQEELDRHVVPVPPDHPDPVDDLRSRVLPGEERQRVAMLQDLAEQRRELAEDGVELPDEGRTIGEPIEDELARKQGRDRR